MNQDLEPLTQHGDTTLQSHKNLALVGYALQALGLVTGVAAIAGLILNYLKRSEVQGSYIASHFTWQIKTFWFSLLGLFIGAVLAIIGIGVLIMFATGIWYIYRIVKGWLALNESKELPNTLL